MKILGLAEQGHEKASGVVIVRENSHGISDAELLHHFQPFRKHGFLELRWHGTLDVLSVDVEELVTFGFHFGCANLFAFAFENVPMIKAPASLDSSIVDINNLDSRLDAAHELQQHSFIFQGIHRARGVEQQPVLLE